MIVDGYFDKIYYRFLKISENPIANVFAIHGLGGHSLWFDKAGELFNNKKINFFSFDLPGFGQSKYPIGTIDSYKTWLNITKEVLKKFLIDFNINSPVFILGHSMGALIAILLGRDVKPNGWILSVPGFQGDSETWPFKNFIFPALLKAILKPDETITLPFGPELLCKSRETQLKVKKDPLRVINPCARIFKEVYLLTMVSKFSCGRLCEPVLMLQAGQDKVCSNDSMLNYYKKIKARDKVNKMYANAYHDLFIEDELSEIVDDISKWITERI